ncbi:MAG: G8 domain-containing protein, partial [Bacteroidales bacterium]|nr:G8 domain-containing protein [Bacteroidales bacterium]
MKGKLLILSLLTLLCFQSMMYAAVRTSVQSGNYSDAATWGGVAPAPNDDIVISTGHTVTLDVIATVKNVTIEVGAILDNSTFDLLGTTSSGLTSNYTNNGTHNGTGKFILSTQGRTFLDGSGNTNCIIRMLSYGMEITNTCNLTINNNIEQGAGFESPTILDAPQIGGMLTINGNITTILTRGGSIINGQGTININGNVSLGGTSSGSGSVIENHQTLNISGDLYLGP